MGNPIDRELYLLDDGYMEGNDQNTQTPAASPTAQNPTPVTPLATQNQNPSVTASSPVKKPFSKRLFLIAGGALLIIIIIVILIVSLAGGSPSKKTDTAQKSNDSLPISNQQTKDGSSISGSKIKPASATVAYGVWSGQKSVIRAYDIESKKSAELASLPFAIKKVSFLTGQSVIYIDQTDSHDHGKQIAMYDFKTNQLIGSVQADEGYGIDDYVLSPNKKYLAVWEVSFAPNAQVLQGGRSRVSVVDLSRPNLKQLLYDESAALDEATQMYKPVHYPRAVLDNGTVFSDKFLPNDPSGGTGWGYGLSIVAFDGTNQQELDQMQNGTYGTQPSLSPDGKYLVFAGYDGTLGDGKAIKDGYRQAILTPNTIELLDTTTLARIQLDNLPNSNTYSSASWDETTGTIITSLVSPDPEQTGLYSYNLQTKSMKKINLPKSEISKSAFLSLLPGERVLAGTTDTSNTTLGNLGLDYALSLNQMYVLDSQSPDPEVLSIPEPLVQYIALLPANYFKGVLGIESTQPNSLNPQPTLIDLYSNQNTTKDRLQLYTFFVKASLASSRLAQQTGKPTTQSNTMAMVPGVPNANSEADEDNLPRCRTLAAAQCRAKGLTNTRSDAYDNCEDTLKDEIKDAGHCYDSPLYLYGTEGKHIKVNIQTPIFNALPASAGVYDITLGAKGNFSINGKTYSSIAYDYLSNKRKVVAPVKGSITDKNGVEQVLKEYAQNLGLNAKETADLVQIGKTKITAPYAFLSFFDQKTSEQILPITFYPEPDNYLNVVFYMKNLYSKPNYSPATPDFPTLLQREGFTAVEVSEMVE